MAYQLEPATRLGPDLARLARGLLDEGIKSVTANQSREERVHRARTTTKKLRALLRLLRASHPQFFRRMNRRLRDAADRLSTLRDAEALVSAAQSLQPAGPSERASLRRLHRRLAVHRQAMLADKETVNEQLVAFRRELLTTRTALKSWHPKELGFDAIAPEVREAYRQARRIGKKLDRAAADTKYHEWRKAVKAFGYHCRLLRGAWPEVTKLYAEEAGRLGDLLGCEHDLTVLRGFVMDGGSAGETPDPRVLKLIDRQRFELRRQAHVAAVRLFAEKSRAYVARLQRWWESAARIPGGAKPALGS